MERSWTGGELSEGEADTSDLRRKDKGIRVVAGAGGRPGGERGETILRIEGGETEGDCDETGLGWLGAGGDGGEALRTCSDCDAGLELLRANGWLDGTELERIGTEVAEARGVEAAGAG